MISKIIRLSAAPLLVAAALSAAPTAASAAACSTNNKYYLTTKTGSDNVNVVPPSSGSPGTDLTISIQAGATVTATFTGALQTEESAIIASAKQTISASIALSLSASVTYTYHWTVPTNYGKTGYLHVGAQRDIFNWKYGYYSPPACGFVTTKSGTSHAPWNLPYSWHGSS
ncbi:MAG: hypothetical protein ACLQFR_16460 [Streptosporangiaceae bacterium]